jgi:hypothetical protein
MEEVKTREERKRVRWQASFFFRSGKKYKRHYFDVIDTDKILSIGHLMDLTVDGMKIVSQQEIKKGDIFNFRIDLPKEVEGVTQIYARVQCVWCNKENDTNMHMAGFKMLSITPPFAEIIEILVDG